MQTPFERLLLATEHSEHDRGAEALGLALARHCGLPLPVVMPVISNPEYEAIAPAAAARADAAAAARREAFAAEAQGSGVALDTSVRHGLQLWREIVEHARELGSELLVIRRRGRPGLLANVLIGDMVSKVLSHAPCPVLVCPREAHMWQQRVLVALAPGEPDDGPLRMAAEVARRCGLPLTLLSVGPEALRAGLEAQAQAWRAGGLVVDVELRQGTVHREIVDAARGAAADLIVVGRHGGNFLGRVWIGGTAQKVIGLAEQPVLVIPPAQERSP
jgi:nucleotide-binding universal stress UspA family protein